ncbi:MAG: ABC transporter permease [Lentisphaeria bacterium]|nr:ABC transporter permease [Lentisphaeria bacterium]
MSQWQLIRRRFARHRLATVGLRILMLMYASALFVEFVAPYTPTRRRLDHMYSPPQLPRIGLRHGLHAPAVVQHVDPITFRRVYTAPADRAVRLGFLVRGEPYRLWGLIPWDRHLVGPVGASGTGEGVQPTWYLLGGDQYGRDLFSRILYGARISLSVGLVGITISFLLGITIGGISGYAGGRVDTLIQRGIEILNAFPHLPLWLALGAALPADWSALKVYFGITVVLSLMGWTGLARVVRGKILALREEDYATAARLLGAGDARILFRHLVPGFTSHIIVSLTLTVPGMILGETSLSFLGLGLRPPVVSWGVLLQDCMNMQVVANYPWMLLPMFFIVLVVLSFNFVGDGLRDAADPYH